jgi:hypothetical protein
LLQILLNQLAISNQLSTQQIAPSANQPIEQVTPVTGHSNAQDSTKEMILLTVYFGAPSMFITLWFGFDY